MNICLQHLKYFAGRIVSRFLTLSGVLLEPLTVTLLGADIRGRCLSVSGLLETRDGDKRGSSWAKRATWLLQPWWVSGSGSGSGPGLSVLTASLTLRSRRLTPKCCSLGFSLQSSAHSLCRISTVMSQFLYLFKVTFQLPVAHFAVGKLSWV